MGFQLPGSVQTNNPVLVHEWAGPFIGVDETAALAAANVYIPVGVRLKGLEVTLIINGVPKKYWYENGTTDSDLVPITSALQIKDEGVIVESTASTLNFTGALVTASGTTGGNVTVNIADCPVVVKVSAHAGRFASINGNSTHPNNILSLVSGHSYWTDRDYDSGPNHDNFGNILSVYAIDRGFTVPLPVDLDEGDIIKISGHVTTTGPLIPFANFPANWRLFYTVSAIECSDFSLNPTPATTIIPLSYSDFIDGGSSNYWTCFNGSVTITTPYSAGTTSLIVAFDAGSSDTTVNYNYGFSYSMDIVKSCGTSQPNLLIRNCCEPLYTEIIAANDAVVGESFSDTDGNCWTVVSETTNPTTSTRTLQTIYSTCSLCIANNPCPDNYVVSSCCSLGVQFFSASIPGISVGDSFVDNHGFCWYVSDITSLPSTYSVTAVTVYPGNECTNCTNANSCPELVILTSCCDLGSGYSTLDSIGGGAAVGDLILDQFGFCWHIESGKPDKTAYDNLNFIQAQTLYDGECTACTGINTCPQVLYYTLSNCCDESIEVAFMDSSYAIDDVFTLISIEKAGVYRVVGWSTTGTPTMSSVAVESYHGNGIGICSKGIGGFGYCPGLVLGCIEYITYPGGDLTGYDCEGNWIYKQVYGPGDTVCMAWIARDSEAFFTAVGGCCFFLTNNSPNPIDLDIKYSCSCPGVFDPCLDGWVTGAYLDPTESTPCISAYDLTSYSGIPIAGLTLTYC